MKVLVYPHTLEIGGSQLNAVEIAAAVRDRGHDVAIFGEEGPLLDHIEHLGLPFVLRTASRMRPNLGVARQIRSLAGRDGYGLVHGYEWPPILEACAAGWWRGGPVPLGTVMSMSVAGFIPRGLPLVVGTEGIRRQEAPLRGDRVSLIEPPVDTVANRPGAGDLDTFRQPDGCFTVAVVSRLAEQLKLEGILTTVRAVGELAARHDIHLLLVGDGPARTEVAEAVRLVNEQAGRAVVTMTGSLVDPRGAYAVADVCIGMGGSALRALAFAKPLVVQGEGGFFSLLTPATLPGFLERGWYGVDALTPEVALDRLVHVLEDLVRDPLARDRLGKFGRDLVVERFSLEAAGARQEQLYRDALSARVSPAPQFVDLARSGVGLLDYKVRRRVNRLRGRLAVDDFNARPV